MFEVVETYMIQLIDWIPGIFALCLLFDLTGNLIFKK